MCVRVCLYVRIFQNNKFHNVLQTNSWLYFPSRTATLGAGVTQTVSLKADTTYYLSMFVKIPQNPNGQIFGYFRVRLSTITVGKYLVFMLTVSQSSLSTVSTDNVLNIDKWPVRNWSS